MGYQRIHPLLETLKELLPSGGVEIHRPPGRHEIARRDIAAVNRRQHRGLRDQWPEFLHQIQCQRRAAMPWLMVKANIGIKAHRARGQRAFLRQQAVSQREHGVHGICGRTPVTRRKIEGKRHLGRRRLGRRLDSFQEILFLNALANETTELLEIDRRRRPLHPQQLLQRARRHRVIARLAQPQLRPLRRLGVIAHEENAMIVNLPPYELPGQPQATHRVRRVPELLDPYIGLNPGQRQSGASKNIKLGVGKRGRGDIRNLLVQGAQAVLRSGRSTVLGQWGWKLFARKGNRNVAVAAVARKLLVQVWHVLSGGPPTALENDKSFTLKLEKLAGILGNSLRRQIGLGDTLAECVQALRSRTMQAANIAP